jgi:DNA-binding NarL/FixJ family response regulator
MIRVLLADDQELVRTGFRMILEATDGIEVVAEADNGRDAVRLAQQLRPDVCLFDIRMPDMDGIEATSLLAGANVDEPLKIVIVTTFDLDEYVYSALQSGALGFLLKNAGPALLIEAIVAAHRGDSLISPEVTTRLLKRLTTPTRQPLPIASSLSPREAEVLREVAQGATNAEIAERLYISLSTVKTHLAVLMNKLGARNRVELVIWAYQSGQAH